MDSPSFAHVPDWSRGCILAVQGAVKPETGFKMRLMTRRALFISPYKKVLTMQFYLPERGNAAQGGSFGTCVHTAEQYAARDMQNNGAGVCAKKFMFVPNSAGWCKPVPAPVPAPVSVPSQQPFQHPFQHPFQQPFQHPLQQPFQQLFQQPFQQPFQQSFQQPFQ